MQGLNDYCYHSDDYDQHANHHATTHDEEDDNNDSALLLADQVAAFVSFLIFLCAMHLVAAADTIRRPLL